MNSNYGKTIVGIKRSYLLSINILVGSIFGGLFIGLTFNGGIGVLESFTERVARQSTFEFGKARMWGSLGWVDWFNNRRLLERIGYVPPVEAEKAYYAWVNNKVLQPEFTD
ncbi:MFS transporter [Serratia fonticola]|uniref:MFS transporter n=1 Tax=Serratia fonticola TaxID=47917 RepID=A0AAJ1YB58_SERFO|nr:MFS transporter [Serratia fonticola]MDQ9126152.1 MFS transporter [Serratia fonticola]